MNKIQMNRFISLIAVALIVLSVHSVCAADFASGPLNRPYSDGRAWHAGFYVGVNAQDLRFAHNGYVTESG